MLLKLSFFIYKIRATHFPKLLHYMTTPEEFSLVVCTELDVYKNTQSRSYLRGTGNMATLSLSMLCVRIQQEAELICKGFLILEATN